MKSPITRIADRVDRLGVKRAVAAAAIAALVLGVLLGRSCGGGGPAAIPGAVSTEHAGHGALQQGPQLWTCAMHPHIKLPQPGQCPICGMELIPLEGFGAAAAAGSMPNLRRISLSPEAEALAGIQTAGVERRSVAREVRMVGTVVFDETRVRRIASWVPGRIDRLYVDFTGVRVKAGDHLVDLYSPELRTAQEELLQSIHAGREARSSELAGFRRSTAATVEAAREKLRLLGLRPEQVAAVEKRGEASDHVTIYAPIGGTVVDKGAFEGAYVSTGSPLYSIADLSQVWVLLDAYESDMAWIRFGQDIAFETEAYPGDVFHGRIAFVDPLLNPRTRTVKVRVNVPNPDGRLKPEMFVRGVVRAGIATGGQVVDPSLAGKWIGPMHPEIVRDESGTCPICGMPLVRPEDLGYAPAETAERPLVIPATAPLLTGERAVVYVRIPGTGGPTFEGREIVLGPKVGDAYVVRAGLVEGEEVVTKGAFHIDSSLQIEARPSMMSPEGGGTGGGHDHGGQKAAEDSGPATPTKIEVPASFEAALRPLYEAYGKLAEALAGDSLDAARAGFEAVGSALGGVPMDALGEHPHMIWMDLSQRLGNSAALGQDAMALEPARRAFASLSRELGRLARDLGPPPLGGLVEVECPMAFPGEAATWLQVGDAVRNPYLGARMPSCGNVEHRFDDEDAHAVPAPPTASPPAPSGHVH